MNAHNLPDTLWAMPYRARATHAAHRARILGLGLSVGIAIASLALAGVL